MPADVQEGAAATDLQEADAAIEPTGLLPPDAAIGADSTQDGAITLTFASRSPPERLLAWYRSPERRAQFSIGSELREGAEWVLNGTTRLPGTDFTVRLAPDPSGGSTGIVLVTGR